MKDEELLARLKRVMEDEGNPTATAARWGIDPSSLAKQLRGERGVSVTTLKAALQARPDVSADWLLRGEGSMTRGSRGQTDTSAISSRTTRLPLLPLGAVAGLPGTDFMAGVCAEDCEWYDIPSLEGRRAQLLVRVSGVSMLPTLDDGDVMAVRRLTSTQELSWGRMYVIDSESGCLVKRLLPSSTPDTVLCHSDNPHYADFTLPHDSIRSLWDVVGLIHGV